MEQPNTENFDSVMLFRPGTQMRWDGQDVDTLVVQDDEDTIAAAKKDGWMTAKEILKEPARKAKAAQEAADKAAAEKAKGGKKDSKPEDLA